jgi:hypothetical protein
MQKVATHGLPDEVFALVVFIYLCAGEDLPPSDDADEGWQWEIQTDEDWVSY